MPKAFEETALWQDVTRVFKDGPKPIRFTYTAEYHTPKANYPALQIVSEDIIRDYVNQISEQRFIEFLLPLGDYIKTLYPYKDELELTLTRQLLVETGEATAQDTGREETRFKAVFLAEENPAIRTSEYEAIDQFTLNLMDIIHVKLQLLNRALEPIRIKTTGGVFQDTTNGAVITAVLGAESSKIQLDGGSALDGVDMVPPDNTEVQRHVVLPSGTQIAAVPSLLQTRNNGVYNAGIGTFLQTYQDRTLWFVYPLFNTQRFAQARGAKALFYSVPRNRFPVVERTYRLAGLDVHILATLGKKYQSGSEADLMSKGSGYRMTDARMIAKKPVEMTEDGPIAHRSTLNHEVTTLDRPDGANYAPIASRPISANPFLQTSQVLQRRGARIDCTWINANPNLLYPGMPCQFVFLTPTNETTSVDGVVLFTHSYVSLQGVGFSATAYTTTTQVTLFVENMEETLPAS